jgi:hypothetical protein
METKRKNVEILYFINQLFLGFSFEKSDWPPFIAGMQGTAVHGPVPMLLSHDHRHISHDLTINSLLIFYKYVTLNNRPS